MPALKNIAIHALTKSGIALANQLRGKLPATLFTLARLSDSKEQSFTSFTGHIADVFNEFDGHIFITATGIAVRSIAPHLQSKDTDPAVIVLDQDGKYAISLLSGHLGGANGLAEQCAAITDGQAVITTATDSAGLPSLDMLAQRNDLAIGNLDKIKVVNGALLEGKTIQVFDEDDLLGVRGDKHFKTVPNKHEWQNGTPGVWVSYRSDCPDEVALRLYPQTLVLGMGCRRDVPEADITAHILNVFDAAGLAPQSIAGLGSVDLKADEVGLLEAAAKLDVKPIFYSKEQLDAVEAPNPSGAVMDRVGVGSVAEASAILLSKGGELLVEKTKTKTVTLAVARR